MFVYDLSKISRNESVHSTFFCQSCQCLANGRQTIIRQLLLLFFILLFHRADNTGLRLSIQFQRKCLWDAIMDHDISMDLMSKIKKIIKIWDSNTIHGDNKLILLENTSLFKWLLSRSKQINYPMRDFLRHSFLCGFHYGNRKKVESAATDRLNLKRKKWMCHVYSYVPQYTPIIMGFWEEKKSTVCDRIYGNNFGIIRSYKLKIDWTHLFTT